MRHTVTHVRKNTERTLKKKRKEKCTSSLVTLINTMGRLRVHKSVGCRLVSLSTGRKEPVGNSPTTDHGNGVHSTVRKNGEKETWPCMAS